MKTGVALVRRIAKYSVSLVVLGLLAGVFFHASGRGQDGGYNAAGEIDQKILAVLHPSRTATLSAQVSSVVEDIGYEMGESFVEKETLIRFSPASFLADKRKADAKLELAMSVYTTNYELHKQKSVSDIELAEARAELHVADAERTIAEKRLADCAIRAPYNGRIVKVLVKEHELVQQGQPLVEIADDRIMRTTFFLPSQLYERTKVGKTLGVAVKGKDETFKCKITHISPVFEPNTSTFEVIGEIDNARGILQGGMTGQVLLDPVKGT